MFYAVEWLKGENVMARQGFEDLREAKAFAKGRFAIEKVRRGATAARVIDGAGVVYYGIGAG
jgi:hypothetical protein